MKISLIDNGLDSLNKAYEHLSKYEKARDQKKSETERFFILKDVTLAVQHGVEILFKCVLKNNNEILLYSDVNQKLRQAYKLRREGEIKELYEADGVHTVSFKESIERLIDICNVDIEGKLKSNLLKVEKWRNSITHSSASLNESEVSAVLSVFMRQLDAFFSKNLGESYTKSSRKKYLDKAFEEYISLHGRHVSAVKHEAMERLISALHNSKILNATAPGVFLVKDPKVAYAILSEIQGGAVRYGFDMANMHCSGNSKVLELSADNVLTIWGVDNLCEYEIGLSGMVVYIPEIEGLASPLIYLFSDGLKPIGNSPKLSDFHEIKIQKGFRFNGGPTNWDSEDYNDFVSNEDDNGEWLVVERFITSGCVCFMNVQQLEYGKANRLMSSKINLPEILHEEFSKYIEEKAKTKND